MDRLDFLRRRNVDLSGIEVREGESFRWAGAYSYDLNARETLRTQLGVFADFQPSIPEKFRGAEWVFLGNIHPELQLDVLDQVDDPRFVACDTMNYWIERTREPLLGVLQRIDMLLVNDSEARELAEEPNLVRAARWIQERGPRHVAIKKGEHGALLVSDDHLFFAPGYPLEEVYDPTGAGDAFAGGVVGHLARAGTVDLEALRRSIVYGCALGSFACEAFGPERLGEVSNGEVRERVVHFRRMTRFETEVGAEA